MSRRSAPSIGALLRVLSAAISEHTIDGFYDRIAPHYDRTFGAHVAHADAMVRRLDDTWHRPSACRVLDLACGTGIVSRRLADRGYQVTGVDISAASLAELRRADPRVCVVRGDAERLPLAEAWFQAVVCLGAWRHFARPAVVVGEIHRVLAPEGMAIIGYFPPKLGAFVTPPGGPLGRMLTDTYAWTVRALGHTDLVGPEHEAETLRALEACFGLVHAVQSGDDAHLLVALSQRP